MEISGENTDDEAAGKDHEWSLRRFKGVAAETSE